MLTNKLVRKETLVCCQNMKLFNSASEQNQKFAFIFVLVEWAQAKHDYKAEYAKVSTLKIIHHH